MLFIYRYLFLMLSGICGIAVYPSTSLAAQLDVTADYKPALYEPSRAVFVSTTKCISASPLYEMIGVCSGGVSSLDFITTSVAIPSIRRTALGAQSNPKDALVYYKISSEKNFTVRSASGQEFPVKFIPRSLGTMHIGPWPGSMVSSIYNSVVGNNMSGSGCRRQGARAFGGVNWQSFQTMVFMNPGTTCYVGSIPSTPLTVTHQNIYLGFSIQAPDPLSMPNGVYTGSLVLTVGQGNEDISFGNGSYSDNQLIINVRLTVRHQIKVEFPAGYDNISLKPSGGWGEWLNGGRPPSILKENIPFSIFATSLFRVSYVCQYSIGVQCALKNTRNDHMVGLDMFYLIPPSTRLKLPIHILPVGQNARGRAIGFEVAGDNVKAMVKYPGSTYKGVVTLVFDALP